MTYFNFDQTKNPYSSGMPYLISLLSAIGSGAGVAWPIYGIVLPLLGATIGGFLSVTLAGVAITGFSLIAMGVFFCLYKRP